MSRARPPRRVLVFSVLALCLQVETWGALPQIKLTASDATPSDSFGISVSISGDTALIGARLGTVGSFDTGSAYVFKRHGAGWSQQAKLTASDGAANDWFGQTVSVSGDTAVVGAHFHDNGKIDAGAAYVFVRSGELWGQQAKITAPDSSSGDIFGFSVSVSGDALAIGARQDDAGAGSKRSIDMWSAAAERSADAALPWSAARFAIEPKRRRRCALPPHSIFFRNPACGQSD